VGTCLRSTHPPPLLRGFTFYEAPETGSPSARLLWHARLDPAVLEVEASPALSHEPDAFDLERFEAFAIVAKGKSGKEHIALSDGYRRIRMDVVSGTLLEGPIILTHRLTGLIGLSPKILALRQLIALTRTRRRRALLLRSKSLTGWPLVRATVTLRCRCMARTGLWQNGTARLTRCDHACVV
jgi:hypothetical protein